MIPSPEAWVAAGGDPRRLALYGSLGAVAPFGRGEHRVLASVHPAHPTVGAVGDWSGDPELLAAAEAWLRAQGCTRARGPMELATWFPYRAVLGPFDEPPFAMEPTARAEPWERAGYRVAATYVSAASEHARQIDSAAAGGAALRAAGWVVEPLAAGPDGVVPPDAFTEAVSLVHRISHAAFTRAYAFAPIPEAALQAWYAPWRPLVRPDLTLLARSPDGEVAGFLFGVPDVAAPERGWFLVKTLAVLPRWRREGVGSWLVAEGHRAARDAGFRAGVHCLMWAGSRSNDISAHAGRVFRRYALLERDL